MSIRGADVMMRALRRAGVTDVFAVSGNSVMSAFDAALDVGIRIVHTRHEASAVHMADARSRVSGRVAIVLVTCGPGHANALSALDTARMAEAPVVLLSGSASSDEAGGGAFQEMAQARIAREVTKAAWACKSAETIGVDVVRAMRIAEAGRPGPVSLSVPEDQPERPAPSRFAAEVVTPGAAPVDAQMLASMLGRLNHASRPLVIVGPSSLIFAGRRIVAAVENTLRVPVVGMESPRGIGDPSLGAFAELLAIADCVLLVGKRIDFTLKFGRSPAISPDCVFLQIDPDNIELERSQRALGERLIAVMRAPANVALAAMTRQAAGSETTVHAGWHDEVCAAIRYRPASWQNALGSTGRLHPVQALRPVQELLDSHPSSVLISDGGEFGQWAQACLQAPHRVINGIGGSIGSALPYAIGARSAIPSAPIVATLGDNTFGLHPAEIDTAVRYGFPFVAVIGNDARWNAEYQIQLRRYGEDRAVGCELLPVCYDQVCAAFGDYGESVIKPQDMEWALRRATSSELPACVNVSIDGVAAPKVSRR